MDNLELEYYIKRNEDGAIGLRYNLEQILVQLVPVPEWIHKACSILKRVGAAYSYTPNLEVLSMVERVHSVYPAMHSFDLIHVCEKIVKKKKAKEIGDIILDLIIQQGSSIKGYGDLWRQKDVHYDVLNNKRTGNVYCIAVRYIKDITEGYR